MPRSAPSKMLAVDQIEHLLKDAGASAKDIPLLLRYSTELTAKGFPVIFDAWHLAMLVGYDVDLLYAVTNSPGNFYRSFRIKKRSGGERQIDEPLPSLKEIQRWLLDNIVGQMEISKAAKAYFPGAQLKANAALHRKQKLVLKLDVTNFFGSITYNLVRDAFFNAGYTIQLAELMSRLCCKSYRLPQGAPTSASLSNVVMKQFDDEVLEYVQRKHIRYSRYADDLTFSGDFEVKDVMQFVRDKLRVLGLRLNHRKIRVLRQNSRQIVTGIVVNEKLQPPRVLRRRLRQELYYTRKFGVRGHFAAMGSVGSADIRRLLGEAAFVLSINPNDKDAKSLLSLFRRDDQPSPTAKAKRKNSK